MEKVIASRLTAITIPGVRTDLVTSGMVRPSEIIYEDGKCIIPVYIPEAFTGDNAAIKPLIEERLEGLSEIKKLLVVLTAEKDAPPVPEAPKLRADKPTEAPGRDMRPLSAPVPGVRSIIAVASGKGGVGKSTTAANLALALGRLGFRTGLLDADIYGPSVPRLMGTGDRHPTIVNERIEPLEQYGIKLMSMGYLVDEENPIIWRGPMVMSGLMQLVREVEWGELDVLVLDMPPGTGDAQLTMAQQIPLQGAVIVSTPQDLALIDARKGLKMFENVDVPIFGIIENMSTFICPHCGEASHIFGHGGAEADAKRLGVPFLGAIPLHMAIREHADEGRPSVEAEPDGPHAKAYRDVAMRVAARLFPEED